MTTPPALLPHPSSDSNRQMGKGQANDAMFLKHPLTRFEQGFLRASLNAPHLFATCWRDERKTPSDDILVLLRTHRLQKAAAHPLVKHQIALSHQHFIQGDSSWKYTHLC
jgi:hypothetical protein